MDSRPIWGGAMSGTSADGVDVAFVRTEPSFELLFHYGEAYEPAVRGSILAARREGAQLTLSQLSRLTDDISNAHIKVIRNAAREGGICLDDVAAVGVHGQTVFHAPPQTLQLVNAPLIASGLLCPVVFDFRRADCAFGGQGAPLVPFADVALFQSSTANRVLLNLGGIANITVVPASSGTTDTSRVRAFDTGPANTISDAICSRFSKRYQLEVGAAETVETVTYDSGGQLASRGAVCEDVLRVLLEDSYFSGGASGGPKSTDTPQMIRAFGQVVATITGSEFSPEDPLASVDPTHTAPGKRVFDSLADALATACAFTAATVAQGVASGIQSCLASGATLASNEWELVVSGGGAFNARIMAELKARLIDDGPSAAASGFKVTSVVPSSTALGMPESAKEAVAFALLARACVLGVSNNLPSCTGASRPVVGGCICPSPVPRPLRPPAAAAASTRHGSLLQVGPVDASSLSQLPREIFETISEAGGGAGGAGGKVQIERILSHGNNPSEDGFWYDQEQNEWVGVIEGEAELSIMEEAGKPPLRRTLKAGDWLDLKAHTKHRVERTAGAAEGRPCIWLAVFYGP